MGPGRTGTTEAERQFRTLGIVVVSCILEVGCGGLPARAFTTQPATSLASEGFLTFSDEE